MSSSNVFTLERRSRRKSPLYASFASQQRLQIPFDFERGHRPQDRIYTAMFSIKGRFRFTASGALLFLSRRLSSFVLSQSYKGRCRLFGLFWPKLKKNVYSPFNTLFCTLRKDEIMKGPERFLPPLANSQKYYNSYFDVLPYSPGLLTWITWTSAILGRAARFTCISELLYLFMR
jgi:hypothetical protein